jgi:hypothetical protein
MTAKNTETTEELDERLIAHELQRLVRILQLVTAGAKHSRKKPRPDAVVRAAQAGERAARCVKVALEIAHAAGDKPTPHSWAFTTKAALMAGVALGEMLQHELRAAGNAKRTPTQRKRLLDALAAAAGSSEAIVREAEDAGVSLGIEPDSAARAVRRRRAAARTQLLRP